MPSEALAATKEEKHIILARAIEEVERIYAALERLQGNIMGAEADKPPSNSASPRPSLQDVLDEGPKILRAKIDNCLSKIDEIHGMLF